MRYRPVFAVILLSCITIDIFTHKFHQTFLHYFDVREAGGTLYLISEGGEMFSISRKGGVFAKSQNKGGKESLNFRKGGGRLGTKP